MKILITILLLIFSSSSFASTVSTPYVYSVGDTVTNVKLNSNQNAITNVVNGGIDNTNVNTTSGYRLFQSVAALPSAGSQGAVYFLTSDNSLNFDTGSTFNKSVSVNSPTNGDILYYNSGWQKLGIGANNTILSSNGTLPSYGLTVGTGASNIVQLDGSSKLPAVDGSALTNLTATLSSIKDYGTSASSSTAKTQANLKIAYGTVSVGSASSQAISNLSFSSSTSYVVQLTYATSTAVNENATITYTSGAAFTINNAQTQTRTISWLAIGT